MYCLQVMLMLKRQVRMQAQHFGMLVWAMLVINASENLTNKLLDSIPIFKDIHHDVVCPSCQYRKSHCLPFLNSKNGASTVLHLVHSDLLGPIRTPSCTSLRYVMVIMDDFSGFTWVYFLEHKNEALSKFIQFKHDAEKEFGLPIKCLHTDNGGEFVSNQFFNYCSEHGI